VQHLKVWIITNALSPYEAEALSTNFNFIEIELGAAILGLLEIVH